MTFEEMAEAIEDARFTLKCADDFLNHMAGMIIGRLRTGAISNYKLAELKRELRDFNIHTSTWKGER